MAPAILLLFVVLTILATAGLVDGLNTTYNAQHESPNTLRKREQGRITLDLCTEEQINRVEGHIREAAIILGMAAQKLKKLYHFVSEERGLHPHDVPRSSHSLLLIYRTYQAFMDRKLPTASRAYFGELYRLITRLRYLEVVFQSRSARISMFCSDDWMTVTDDRGRRAPRRGQLWDDRDVPRSLKINGGWFYSDREKFRPHENRPIETINDMPGEIAAVVTLNQYRFEAWTKIDRHQLNYQTFKNPHAWVQNPADGSWKFFDELDKLAEWSGKVGLADMVKDHLSAIMIMSFSMIPELAPPRQYPLEFPDSWRRSTYGNLWTEVTGLARRDPVKAHRSGLNVIYLCVALHLDQWDWSTGVNRGWWEINDYDITR